MSVRRLLSLVLLLAGVVLLGIAGLHYCRGHLAQLAGRRDWERSLAATPSSTAAAPATMKSTPRENPGITAVLPAPAAPSYPYGRPIARLRIPAAEMDYVVFGGDDQATLEKGPGHVPGSELPGEETSRKNCVITAHRDSHFRHLGWLHKGHRIELETPSGTVSYRVVSREIVNPDAVRVLQATATSRLTLITCYPFNWVGAAPQRLVVVAEPVASPKRPPSAFPKPGG
jgi:sortase A